ncbi:MAG: sulfotransferase [Pseudomonadota bacterium]
MFQGDTQVETGTGDLTLEQALTAAKAESGLSDFGDEAFLEPLQAFIDGVKRDLSLSAMGDINFRATVQRLLVNRLRIERDIRSYPEILDEDVSDPIMILGMPRTGTTKLQRLLCCDGQFHGLPLWQLLNPAPFDGERAGDPAQRLAFARAVEEATRANPAFTASHETSALEVDEDSFLMLMTFDYPLLFSLFPSRTYLHWVQQRDRSAAHRYQRRLLQYLQWQNGGRAGKRWILKNPGAIGCIAALQAVFPNITFVHSERSMLEVMPSYCRLMEAALTPLLESLDPISHGQDSLHYWQYEMQRFRDDVNELGEDLRMLSVSYLDIVKDPMAVVRDIYSLCSLKLAADAEKAMASWQQSNRQHKHGKAQYSLEQYGLTSEQIGLAFPSP